METNPKTKNISLSEMTVKAIAHNLKRYNFNLIKSYLSPVGRQMVIEYINGGGIAGSKNIDCFTVVALLTPFTKYFGYKLLQLTQPSPEMTVEETAHLIDLLLLSLTAGDDPKIEHLELTFRYNGRLVNIRQSSFDALCRLRNLSFLSVGDLQILLTQFVQITLEIATLNFIEARRVEINEDLGLLVGACDKFAFQEIYYRGSAFCEDLIRAKMCTGSDLVPSDASATMRYLSVDILNSIAQLEKLGQLSHLTHLILCLKWDFQGVELTLDNLPGWPELKVIEITANRERKNCKQYLRRLLNKYGNKLESLALNHFGPESDLTLEMLFGYCLNLRSFKSFDCQISGMACFNSLHQLRELSLIQRTNYRPIYLHSFLFANQLEVMRLLITDVCIFDLITIMEMAMIETVLPAPAPLRLLPNLRDLVVEPLVPDIHQNAGVLGVPWALLKISVLRDSLQTLSGAPN